VLRIRINFNADGDPAFYLNADSDPDLDHRGSQTNADRDPDPAQSMLNMVMESVADLDPGSGIGCLFHTWIRDPDG
jgi:hypothetical protein